MMSTAKWSGGQLCTSDDFLLSNDHQSSLASQCIAARQWRSPGWAGVNTCPHPTSPRWVMGFAKFLWVLWGMRDGGRVSNVLYCGENSFISCRLCVNIWPPGLYPRPSDPNRGSYPVGLPYPNPLYPPYLQTLAMPLPLGLLDYTGLDTVWSWLVSQRVITTELCVIDSSSRSPALLVLRRNPPRTIDRRLLAELVSHRRRWHVLAEQVSWLSWAAGAGQNAAWS